ncbi:SGNH/GDSL hydrolase family protein [Natranaerofaba carboxydovora]|uniref:SGNH/GDSL hydrolase family protein n=1 Tax=Natranaerofaba carboxydovora TaxID=2742683 RepID=UPI001F13FB6E|nr:SGNH/GDSL hydrolase family protein [Natranaerofaba carboxydovora]UMZ74279.1 GDSL-like Lipase/Acylhydrolase [Natranaerofaba carboxydovora]
MKKHILFIGDSITEGNTGESYLKIIKEKLGEEEYEIYNHGMGGDTLLGVKNRLIDIISRDGDFDIIVIEVGHNDIVLPYLEKNDPTWQRGVQMLKEEGIVPAYEASKFEENLDNTFRLLKDNHRGKVIMTTLSCLGEDLESELNQQRKKFNEIIHRKAKEYGFYIADVGSAFDEELMDKQDSVIKKELVNTFLNPPSTGLVGDGVGSFYLTLDGVHINRKGAEIYAEEIMKEIRHAE